tara:strand:+ start:1429 stop:2115 length:687 start_codon:yes stop_codon:yes gene_type:complete
MTGRMQGKAMDYIPVNEVILSVSDKSGLEDFVPGLVEANPDVRLLSTGGTFGRIKEILGSDYRKNLMEIAEFTGFPEMPGGLVKTLHPKVHAGILGERDNPHHGAYIEHILDSGVYIDMVVVNLYPFSETIKKKGKDFEDARSNIDIGGPTMIRAAAKNFQSCAVVCDPSDYGSILKGLRDNEGMTSFDQRFKLAIKGFDMTDKYDAAIKEYLSKQDPQDVRELYEFY